MKPGRGRRTQCSYTGGHVLRVGPTSPWLLAPSADGFDTGVCVHGMSEGIPQCQRLPSPSFEIAECRPARRVPSSR